MVPTDAEDSVRNYWRVAVINFVKYGFSDPWIVKFADGF